MGVTFRNLTANVQHTDPAVQTTAEIRRLSAAADVIGWQEIETTAQVAALKGLAGFAHYLPGGAANAVAISWRSDVFELVSASSRRVHKGVAGITPARYINTAVLRHKATGRLMVRINTHVINGIESGGLPINNGRRIPFAKTHMSDLRTAIEAGAKVGPVIWGGDLNIAYNSELRLTASKRCPWFPLTSLAPVSAFDMPATPSHGKRSIDWTGHTGALEAERPTLLPLGYSDHRAVLTIYTFA